MKPTLNKQNRTKALFPVLTLIALLGFFSSHAQDSIKIKNRHDVPDTVIKTDTTKLKGGALIDTINTKNKIKPGGSLKDSSYQEPKKK